MTAAEDPLVLGQRIVALLETGLRTATYKLATLMALTDYCVENLPHQADDELGVPIQDLAERVVEIYWRQVLPFESFGALSQSTQSRARIPRAVTELRNAAAAQGIASPSVVRDRLPVAYWIAVDEVATTLAQQPLHRLQRIQGQPAGIPFLYDDSWLHDHVSRRSVQRHGGAIRLFPGVATGLARLSGLLRPTLEILWVQDVIRMNASLRDGSPDLAGHLFGRERISMARVREAYYDEYGERCFYCGAKLTPTSPIDHVLPWSRVGIDGLANLVSSCHACNAAKANSLPALAVVTRVIDRDPARLVDMGQEIGWPVQYDRVVRTARGLFLASVQGTPTWCGRNRVVALDLHHAPSWLSVEIDPS